MKESNYFFEALIMKFGVLKMSLIAHILTFQLFRASGSAQEK